MANRKTRVAGLPRVRASDPETQRFFDAVTQTLEVGEGVRGDSLDAKVTWRGLVDARIARRGQGGDLFEPDPDLIPDPDAGRPPHMSTPPAPTGFDGMGAIRNIMLDWDDPREIYRNHSHTEIWRAATNDRGQAILVGQSAGFMYRDEVGPGARFYYWIRFVSTTDVIGPDHGVDGLLADTGIDVDHVLDVITGEIRDSHLHQSLGDRIALADRIPSIEDIIAGMGINLDNLQVISQAQGASIGQLIQTTDGHAVWITRLEARVDDAESAITTLQHASATQAQHILALNTRVSDAESSITTLQRTTADQATHIVQLGTRTDEAESAITTLQQTTATHAQHIQQLSTEVFDAAGGSRVVALERRAETFADNIGGLHAQYTVKIDNRGHVAGFGLASSSNAAGGTTSAFGVRADRFWIASAGDWTTTNPPASKIPFIVQTGTTVSNGETIQPGVYMRDAFIANGTITRAKIGNAAIDTAKIADLAVDEGKIRNLAVSTLKIAGNAVTVPAVSHRDYTQVLTAEWRTVGRLWVSSTGSDQAVPFFVFVTGRHGTTESATGYAPFSRWEWMVRQGTSVILYGSGAHSSDTLSGAVQLVVSPGGSIAVEVRARQFAGAGDLRNVSIVAIGARR